MSTYYQLYCDDCQQCADAASKTMSGICHVGNSSSVLLPFIVAHSQCGSVRIINEHDDEYSGHDCLEWTGENWREIFFNLVEKREADE